MPCILAMAEEMCALKFSLLSSVTPRYFTVCLGAIRTPFTRSFFDLISLNFLANVIVSVLVAFAAILQSFQ